MILPVIAAAALALPGVAQMRWDRRLLVVAGDADRIDRQRAELKGLGEDDRDLMVVTITGDRVGGAADSALSLRRRYGLVGGGVVLVGKDGTVKLRSRDVIRREVLISTIDAMPIRRAGGR